jgi:hypothetical protein
MTILTGKLDKLKLEDGEVREEQARGSQAVSEAIPPAATRQSSRLVQLDDKVTVRPARTEEDVSATANKPLDAPCLPPPVPETPRHPEALLDLRVEQLGCSIKEAKAASPTKSASPLKQPYLSKESNLRNFTVWDVDDRLDGIDAHFKDLKDVLSLSLNDRKVLEDAVDIAKRRGRWQLGMVCGTRI